MNVIPRSGWIAAIAFSVFSMSALGQGLAIDPGVGPNGFPALGSACEGGEVYDDGTVENGYSGNAATVSLFEGVQQFTPDEYPGTYNTVCVCLISLGGPTLDFEVEVRDDDGTDGGPGTLLGTVPVSVDDIPSGLPGQFYEVDINSLGLSVDAGNVWIGARWNPMDFPSRFVCADETPATPLHPGFVNFNLGDGWEATESNFANYRAKLVRALGGTAGQATFAVSKDFDDNNTAEVEVTLSCNTGLPLEQTTTISEGDPVNIVINDFEPGALDCEVTEAVPAGYTASYDNGTVSADSCAYENVIGGQHSCEITNALDEVEIEVTKVWIDENPQFEAQNVAGATWSCSNVAFPCANGFANDCNNGNLDFFGNPGVDAFSVFPDWEVGTTCSITEVNLLESGIEVDDSECQGLVVLPGTGASCTIYNTRLYEGIPTLSQYGLGILALLMLGVGFVAFRRVI